MRWRSATPEQTESIGARLASTRPPEHDAVTVVYLTGDLGAGKTTLAKGFLRACGFDGAVLSPTYTLQQVYETRSGVTVLHLDLYRMRDPSELEQLGLRDWARPGYIWLIEWPERGAGFLPPPDLFVSLTVTPAAHEIEATAQSAWGESWIERLAAP